VFVSAFIAPRDIPAPSCPRVAEKRNASVMRRAAMVRAAREKIARIAPRIAHAVAAIICAPWAKRAATVPVIAARVAATVNVTTRKRVPAAKRIAGRVPFAKTAFAKMGKRVRIAKTTARVLVATAPAEWVKRAAIAPLIAVRVAATTYAKQAKAARVAPPIAVNASCVAMAFAKPANRAAIVLWIAAVPAETAPVRPSRIATIAPPIAVFVAATGHANPEKIVNRVRVIAACVAAMVHAMRVRRAAVAPMIVRVAAMALVRAAKIAITAPRIVSPRAGTGPVNAVKPVPAVPAIAVELAAIPHAAMANADSNAAKTLARALPIVVDRVAATCNARRARIARIAPPTAHPFVVTACVNAAKTLCLA